MPKTNSFVPIPETALSSVMGKRVHVNWARWGCTWELIKVDGRVATLRTPTTRKIITTDISTLFYTKKHAPTENATKG
jgi:hypothetical protein